MCSAPELLIMGVNCNGCCEICCILARKFLQTIQIFCFPLHLLKRSVRWLFHSRARRRFVLTNLTIYCLTYILILPCLMRNLPLTKYYRLFRTESSIIGDALEMNRRYADLAQGRLASLHKEATKKLYEEAGRRRNLEMVIAVVTTRRAASAAGAPRYLTQVMVALHEALRQSADSATLLMCNTDRLPAMHAEAAALSEYFPMVEKRHSSTAHRYEREKRDYVFCLSEAQKLSSRYVLLLQDDALPHPDFYSVLKYVLKHRVESQIHRGNPHQAGDDWLWLKLNFPALHAKYEHNYFLALEWIATSILLATLSISFLCLCCKNWRLSEETDGGGAQSVHLHAAFVAAFAYFMLLLWVAGRAYINLPRCLSESLYTLGPGTSCCLPAVLFPRPQIPGVVGYLEGITLDENQALDFALDDYLWGTGLRQYLITPNLFTHIGVMSALHGRSSVGAAENYLFSMAHLAYRFPDFFH